jgi:hypothetical protein
MLVFGPASCIPEEKNFSIYNLSSLAQGIHRLPRMLPLQIPQDVYTNPDSEKMFDLWYYNYIMVNPVAFVSLMMIMLKIFNGKNVYICISNYASDKSISIMNESLMKMIQARYGITCHIVNTPEDFKYIKEKGCDFSCVGLKNMMDDESRFEKYVNDGTIKALFSNYPV